MLSAMSTALVPPVEVVIPWRDAPTRRAPFALVRRWYETHLPEASVRTIDTDDDVFVLAACRNLAMRTAHPDAVVVIGDADTLPEQEPLRAAIAAARTSGRVHLPYDEYRWLGASGSAEYASGTPLVDCTVEQYVEGACSGVYVATPQTWFAHGGQDEAFRGWGFEDAAWYLTHQAVLGEPPRRHAGRVYALHHAAEQRVGAGYEANEARMGLYRAAASDPGAIARLIGIS